MDMRNWNMVVALVQAAFGEGWLAEEATWHVVVLMSKGGSRIHQYRASGGSVEGSGGDY